IQPIAVVATPLHCNGPGPRSPSESCHVVLWHGAIAVGANSATTELCTAESRCATIALAARTTGASGMQWGTGTTQCEALVADSTRYSSEHYQSSWRCDTAADASGSCSLEHSAWVVPPLPEGPAWPHPRRGLPP